MYSLSCNEIGDDGAMGLGCHLKKSPNLQTLK